MERQPGLPLAPPRTSGASGAGPPRAVRHALFFALVPEPVEARRFREIGAALQEGTSCPDPLTPAGRLHLSVLGLGGGRRLGERAVAAGLEIGAAVRWRRFDMVFDAVVSFGAAPRHALALVGTPGSSAAVAGLRDALGLAGEELGFGVYTPGLFAPHLTLAYASAPAAETVLDEPVVWRPRELVLIHSLQGLGRHIRLGAWPLRD